MRRIGLVRHKGARLCGFDPSIIFFTICEGLKPLLEMPSRDESERLASTLTVATPSEDSGVSAIKGSWYRVDRKTYPKDPRSKIPN